MVTDTIAGRDGDIHRERRKKLEDNGNKTTVTLGKRALSKGKREIHVAYF